MTVDAYTGFEIFNRE